MSHVLQSSTASAAQPVYILRGHAAQVHSLHFLRDNLQLLSGDADGWVVFWDMTIKRAVGVWKAHNGPILGLGSWGDDKIITHGRDSKLCVWQLRQEDQSTLSNTLPIDDNVLERKQPWLLHSLTVHTLNFCSFAMCLYPISESRTDTSSGVPPILIATPGIQDGHINVTSLPSEDRVATIPSPTGANAGMIMAIGLYFANNELTVLAGYESGHVTVWRQSRPSRKWLVKYLNKTHTQPVLSLDIAPTGDCFFTSSADAIIARHPVLGEGPPETKFVQTKHAGQQSIKCRSDGRIFATAGWDCRVRVYSKISMKELAVLKWHKEGCYATAFAQVDETSNRSDDVAQSQGEPIRPQLSVSEQRTEKAKTTHLLAAGSKDGKVSLWDVY